MKPRHCLVLFSILLVLRCGDASYEPDLEPKSPNFHIPEKIIGGVIDIVHNHKHRPQKPTESGGGGGGGSGGGSGSNSGHSPHRPPQGGYNQYPSQSYNPAPYPGEWVYKPYPQYQPGSGGGGGAYRPGQGAPGGSGGGGGAGGSGGSGGSGGGGYYPPQQPGQGQYYGKPGPGPTCICQAWSKPVEKPVSEEEAAAPGEDPEKGDEGKGDVSSDPQAPQSR